MRIPRSPMMPTPVLLHHANTIGDVVGLGTGLCNSYYHANTIGDVVGLGTGLYNSYYHANTIGDVIGLGTCNSYYHANTIGDGRVRNRVIQLLLHCKYQWRS